MYAGRECLAHAKGIAGEDTESYLEGAMNGHHCPRSQFFGLILESVIIVPIWRHTQVGRIHQHP